MVDDCVAVVLLVVIAEDEFLLLALDAVVVLDVVAPNMTCPAGPLNFNNRCNMPLTFPVTEEEDIVLGLSESTTTTSMALRTSGRVS